MSKREPLRVKVGDLLLCRGRGWFSTGEREFLVETVEDSSDARPSDLRAIREVDMPRGGFSRLNIVRVATPVDIQRVKEAERLRLLRVWVRIGYESDLVKHLDKVPEKELTALLAALESAIKAAGVKSDG